MIASAATLAAPAAASQEQVVRCTIGNGAAHYRGSCMLLVTDERGSFEIAPAKRARFFGRMHAIRVTILPPGDARVHAYSREAEEPPRPLDLGGPVSVADWGVALRSPRGRSCWVGSGFSVCAY
jgi:hypothetical protein